MFLKRPSHRVFDYTPRHYKPEEDEQERRKRKLGFSRQRKYVRKKRNPIIWLIFILMVIFLFFRFGGKF